jgi:hypothetical protein
VVEISTELLLAGIKQLDFLLTSGTQNFRFKCENPLCNKRSLQNFYQYFHNTLLIQSGSEMI